jgi:hypothetical protein
MTQARRHTFSARTLAVLLALVAASGCSLNTDVNAPGLIAPLSGDQQTQLANTALPLPLQVLVASQFGERLMNQTVTWTITAGGGTLSVTGGGSSTTTLTSITDDSGIAEMNYTAGASAGTTSIQARVGKVPPITFTVTIT